MLLYFQLLDNSRRYFTILRQDHIVIVGAGIVGLSTAFALLQQGMRNVTIVEQSTVGHERAASHGVSRLLRFEYGADQFYTEMVQVSLQRWRKLEQITRRSLYTPTGILVLGNTTDGFTKTSYDVLRDLGYPSESLSRQACHKRFPQFALQDYNCFTYNREGGMLDASYCLQTLKDAIRQLGGTLLENQLVTQISHDNALRPIRLRLVTGSELTSDRLVLAVGSWVHRLLGDLHLPVRLTRQYVLYFANLPISTFGLSAFPAFMAAGELYGFPIDGRAKSPGSGWLKVASHTFGVDVDPDDVAHIEPQVVDGIKHDVCRLLPDLQQASLVHVDSCVYDVSPDERFILDMLPDDPRIVFATGLSGHGFKFGLLLGEMLSSLLCQCSSPVDMERFRLSRFH
jgi:monomeric sarcosine oxidase